ncbi:flagellar motor switch protein FliN/FliY [Roseibium hamelinense]|uniref:Flagellar motor switch protein FliN n=1 Tax=Roseibium hamelinense TaxID=150831 RepID=A0A562TIC3_9HYPH|nr:flagellar motor switch protein FliN [Roseibium hamelinense]MTI45897.1 flagellar motor switch protein FliN [Roseibium hamelinense]TWI92918.1 flagellar motor switch protein FliN/FliY [Roseibium hamelinense]
MNDTTDGIVDHVEVDANAKVNPATSSNFAKVESDGSASGKDGGSDLLGDDRNLDTILGIPVNIQVVLGSATMLVSNLLKLGRGAVIPLNHRVGEPIDIVVNGRVIARGEVVVVEDDNSRFGVSLTEIISSQNGPLEA